MRFPGFAALLNSDNHFQNILRIFDFGQNAPLTPKSMLKIHVKIYLSADTFADVHSTSVGQFWNISSIDLGVRGRGKCAEGEKKYIFRKILKYFGNDCLKKTKIGRNEGLAFVLTGNYDISVWYP